MSARTKRARQTVGRSVRAASASLVVTAVVLAGLSAPASAAAALLMSLSTTYGPSGGGGKIVGTVAPTSALPAPFSATVPPTVQFQTIGTGANSCSSTAMAITQIVGSGTTVTAGVLTVDPAAVKPITGSRIVFAVPSASYPGSPVNMTGLVLVGAQTQAKWNVCVYDSDSTTASTLLAASSYTIAVQPTITSISPASSPAAGRQTITVNGNGFAPVTTTLTGSIGGAALSNIKVATNGKSFTATTGVHAAATGLALIVITPGGPVSSLDPDNDSNATGTPIPFSYTNGITITPSTAASGSPVTIDITGAGFSSLNFDTTGTSPTSAQAHVFLVDGGYVSGSNRGVAECVVDTVVSDTELVCTVDLSASHRDPTSGAAVGSPVPDGAYIVTVVQDGSTGAGAGANPSIISSGAAFVVGPY